ncbi:MAG TPA: amidohydrolase family protein [Ktedonobacteraceae bacterium]|nr:amidohydrolase family protein [Ktedonobacteraceae bacterium]
MKKITLEEHFSAPEALGYRLAKQFPANYANDIRARLQDIEAFRLPEMDLYGIDMQVLSLNAPGIQGETDTATAINKARQVNDSLAELIRKHPTRFSGFAALPLQDPKAAADELERAVTQLGLKGALVNGHTNGEYLDQQKFWGVFERAQGLGVPIYLHPNDSPREQLKAYDGYPELLGATWNWGMETATHALRLVFGGVFNEFPATTLILGHMGEMLPYVLARLDERWDAFKPNSKLKKAPSQYIKENMLVTTSGNVSAASLLCALLTLGAEHILFSVDYPYQSTRDVTHFIETAPISDVDKEKICYRNVERVLKL